MKDTQKNSLVTELTTDESATINGGYYYSPCHRRYYPSYWGYPSQSTNTTVNVSTYVNVEVETY